MWNELSMEAVGGRLDVLIVEDEVIARNALAMLLAKTGYVTRAEGSAEMALQRLQEGDRPEIALVDLDLPGMNGVEFIAHLSAQQPSVFPILITAASAERLQAIGKLGITHLRKPLDFKELLKLLDQHNRTH